MNQRKNEPQQKTAEQQAPAATQPRAAADLAKVEEKPLIERVTGNRVKPDAVNWWLNWAASHANLVSPSPGVGQLIDGTAIAFSVVHVDTREISVGGEVYGVGGKWALTKSALDRIAMAVGIAWDPVQCRREDDGSDPRYCEYVAVGSVMDFTGRELPVFGRRVIDLREGSDQTKGQSAKQVGEARKFTVPLAESKARNRAIRSIGLKTGYTWDELALPFVCAKIIWTGQTNDPELRRAFAMAAMEKFTAARGVFYGRSAGVVAADLAVRSAPPLMQRVAPPPIGSVHDDEDEDEKPTPAAPPPGPRTHSATPPTAQPPADEAKVSGEEPREPGDDSKEY